MTFSIPLRCLEYAISFKMITKSSFTFYFFTIFKGKKIFTEKFDNRRLIVSELTDETTQSFKVL